MTSPAGWSFAIRNNKTMSLSHKLFWSLVESEEHIDFDVYPVAIFTIIINEINDRDDLFLCNKKYRKFVVQHQKMHVLHELRVDGGSDINSLPCGTERLRCHIRKEEIINLFNSKSINKLHTLILWVKKTSVDEVATSRCTQSLKILKVGYNMIEPFRSVKCIADSENFRGLEELCIWHSGILDQGTKYIAESKNLRGLKRLTLRNNNITSQGAKYLADSENLRGLKRLDIDSNDIGLEGLKFLAESRCLLSLTFLDVRWNGIDMGLRYQYKHKNNSMYIAV